MRSFGAVVSALAVTTATVLLSGAPAQASSFEPSEFSPLCTPTDPALQELSGIVDVDDRIYAMGDGGSDDYVFEMNLNCVVQKRIPAPLDPYDVEDHAASEGTSFRAAKNLDVPRPLL